MTVTVEGSRVCDVSSSLNAGWCWEYNIPSQSSYGDPSNPWDKHEHIVAYFTAHQAPSTINGYNVGNNLISGGYKLEWFGTLASDHVVSNRNGIDSFNNDDPLNTTDFNQAGQISIPRLRSGVVTNPVNLDDRINSKLSSLRSGDYILIDPVNTNGGGHGLLVVGWGPIVDCSDAWNSSTRYTITDFTDSRTITNTVPYVVDFTTRQSPTSRPFYCTMAEDNVSPVVGFFNQHDWYFYSLPDSATLPLTRLYIDPNWNW